MTHLAVGKMYSWLASRMPLGLLAKLASPAVGDSTTAVIARSVLRPLRFVDLTIPYGQCAGLRFNAAGSAPSFALGTSEPHVQSVLADLLEPGKIFFDIGANVGFYTLLGSRRVTPSGHVYAFEPLPANIAGLERNLVLSGLEGVTVLPYAVADRSGPMEFLVAKEPFWGRLNNVQSPRQNIGAISVTGVSIDEMVASGRVRPPDVVKIDVEGAEGLVLRGMRQTLRSARPTIVCELHASAAEVTTLLNTAGYTVQMIAPNSRKKGRSRHLIAAYAGAVPSKPTCMPIRSQDRQ